MEVRERKKDRRRKKGDGMLVSGGVRKRQQLNQRSKITETT